jgi:hypothetical protein
MNSFSTVLGYLCVGEVVRWGSPQGDAELNWGANCRDFGAKECSI